MIAALAGGVGGAKLAQGLASAFPGEALSVVVNTADDFELFGLRICPDLDTVMYTLAGLANPATGWGIKDDTRSTLDAIGRYGRNLWFQLGDSDFATHILRSERLRQGVSLTDATAELADALGVRARLLPMTDDTVATMVDTSAGLLDFQEYFVARRQADVVDGIVFRGAETAAASAEALAALASARITILCPSNPLVSIGPILAVRGYREALTARRAPAVALSPIAGGRALKGPAADMLRSLGHEVSAFGVAAIYAGLIDGIVIDEQDEALTARIEGLGMAVHVARTVMGGEDDRRRLAAEMVAFGERLAVPAGTLR
ncbi:MAG: 2-phospho-L-lactate transferase [Thermomicrobiales bacterium]